MSYLKIPGRSAALVLLLIAIALTGAHASAVYREGEILIRYKPGFRSQVGARAASIGAKVTREIPQIRAKRLKLPPGLSVPAALERFRKDPNVEYAGPNHIVSICLHPNDEIYTSGLLYVFTQWGLYDPDYGDVGIQAPDAWNITTGGSNIVIAVVDTGVESIHEDLYAKIVPGINTIDGQNPSNSEDDHGHGTFVAGVAAAMTNNYIGIAGVSWGARIMPVKALDADGYGTEADAAEGIVWAADNGAHIINMSFGGYDDVPVEQAAIEYAWNKGCVLVAASGNDGSNADFFPAFYDQVIAVGATNELMQRCTEADWYEGGSNYGAYLDVMAPGNNIVSSTLTSAGLWGPYEIASGTSAAAPFVSGIAALIKSAQPSWTNAQIADQIKSTARDIDAPGWDQYTGWGVASAYRALANQPTETITIGALNDMPGGSFVRVGNAVITSGSNMLSDRFYVEQPDRACGIMISYDTNPPAGYFLGDVVDIAGTLMTISGERAIQGATLTKKGTQTPIAPMSLSSRWIGGSRLGLKSGVTNGVGLNNIGLLVSVYGRVVSTFTWTYFYIDDGSGLFDGSGLPGLKVICGGLTKPPEGAYVRVTGISSIERPAGTSLSIPVIRARRQSDIQIIN